MVKLNLSIAILFRRGNCFIFYPFALFLITIVKFMLYIRTYEFTAIVVFIFVFITMFALRQAVVIHVIPPSFIGRRSGTKSLKIIFSLIIFTAKGRIYIGAVILCTENISSGQIFIGIVIMNRKDNTFHLFPLRSYIFIELAIILTIVRRRIHSIASILFVNGFSEFAIVFIFNKVINRNIPFCIL